TAYRQLPMVVALPETEEQVRRVLQLCASMNVPVVPRGAGTGLSGGALPLGDGVLLSMAKFMRVLRVDPRARVAVVQPGVRNAVISEVAAPHGLYYAPDQSSQIACTIGGNVAENSGGVHCLKYGLTVHNVLRLRGLTIDGEPLEVGAEAPDTPGLDLLALAIGSEGMLFVVTEVTVKLLPKPQCAPQSSMARGRPHLGLGLLHGRHDSSEAPGRGAALHRRHGEEVRPPLPECISRQRRQPASADSLRRQQR